MSKHIQASSNQLALVGLPTTKAKEEELQFGNPNVNEVISHFEELYGYKLPKQQLNRRAAWLLIRQHGLEKTLSFIKAAHAVRGAVYAPQIYNLMDLRDKLPNLADFYRREEQKRPTVGRV